MMEQFLESEQPSSSLLEIANSESGVSTSSIEEGKCWYELLEKKIGLNINSRKWIEDHPELARKNKSELIIRLALELCLAKNTEYDPERDSVENEDGKCSTFDTKMIFALFEVVSEVIEKPDRKRFIEFVCRENNVKLLKMICRQENKDGGGRTQVNRQYSWKGDFTGYERLIDILQYVLKEKCSSEIVLCIAEKVYGNAHILFNGEQYLDRKQVARIKESFNYSDLVIKDCLKAAIELGYEDVVSVMLSGDVYHCIRVMIGEGFQGEERFSEALKMIEETVAEVMSSWVNDEGQSFKDEVQRLLKEGIEVDINEMGRKDLIDELEDREIKLSGDDKKVKVEKLREKLKGKEVKLRLRKTVVGGLISALFFNYRDELMDEEPFELKILPIDKSRREKEVKELKEKIDSKRFVKETVLEKIRLLNLSSRMRNGWFFREVLSAIVNGEEKLGKLKAVCAAICKEPMEILLKGEKVHKVVAGALKFFGVQVLSFSEITPPRAQYNRSIIDSHFSEDVKELKNLAEEKATGVSGELQIDKESAPAFSKESRAIILKLKNKKNITGEEKDNLSNLVSQAMVEIKKGIDILAKGIDIEDIFKHFEVINSEIGKEDKREIVQFVCRENNVKLLEMICRQENKDGGGKTEIDRQYSWKGEFTGYERLIDLLQYVLKEKCSSEIVLCIAEKVYGRYHNVLCGREYLENSTIQSMEKRIGQPNSVMKECLKAAIELGYKDVVSVMLSGDVYHCIRLMIGEGFQGKKGVVKPSR